MTEPHDATGTDPLSEDDWPEGADPAALAALDARARTAAAGLHRHVRSHVATTPAAPAATRGPQKRSRILVVAAVAALVVGFVATQDPGGRDGGRLDLDESELPDMQTGLTPLGPRDGRDSIQLPLTAEPSTGLRDGDTITVTGEGFQPGEAVGIVQCAREAGGDSPEVRAGVEACNIGGYTPVTADESGVATGTHQLRRILTTPITGTVDCAAEAERCMVAMGAVSDYDRSGGALLTFDPEVDPVVLPTVTVEPADDLAHGQTVRVVAEGLTPGELVYAQVCSSDPAACWSTGRAAVVTTPDAAHGEAEVTILGRDSTGHTDLGLVVDDAGRVDAEVPVWRFLPSHVGAYVDCAVSRCSLRLSGTAAPPTVPLGFRGDEPPPEAPAVGVEPATGLSPGHETIVAGRGFTPGADVWADLCVGPADAPSDQSYLCASGDRTVSVDGEGAFAMVWKVPDLDQMGAFDLCEADGTCRTVDGADLTCDGTRVACTVVVYASEPGGRLELGASAPPPTFQPAPVTVTFAP